MTSKKTSQGASDASFVAGWSSASAARLKEAIKRYGSQDKVAAGAGISRQALVEILRFDEMSERGSRPRYKTLEAICKVVNADPAEVIGTLGRVVFGPPDDTLPLAGDVRLGDEDFSVVKRHMVNVSAGPGLIPTSEAFSLGMAFPRSWLVKRGIAADLAGLVQVRGDSMAPTILDGDTVLVHIAEMSVLREGIFAFSRGGEAYVKRLVPVDVGKDGRPASMVIISDNNEYPPEVVSGRDLNDIRIVGRIRCVLSDL